MPGITYIRTSRPKTPLLYSANEEFSVPGFKVLRRSDNDAALVVAAGIAVHEALKAFEQLKSENIALRIVDLYCVKPIEGSQIVVHLKACKDGLITVEDHYPEGGLGEAIVSALAEAGTPPARFKKLAVNGMPHSEKSEELLEAFGISGRHFAEAAVALAG